ncbi:LTA synthase family protein [uncultured Azonexus sp.]|uniref:LTA synthase family protein n=1 Tax=uncultured Azonexus sp. TaxID=520307 RepID=UPI00262C81C9|nr:LTA synthase family protein [uncultured Azonexus sp.]
MSWLAGLVLSFALLALLRPAIPAPWSWRWRGILLHGGLWLVVHALLVLLLGRLWFAMALGLALLMLIVQVSNAKYHALREPFVFQDFEYFTDALRHPRLYIPFLGWWKFLVIVLVLATALAIGLWLEPVVVGVRPVAAGVLALGAMLLVVAARGGQPLFEPLEDMRREGLLASLWDYGWAERQPLNAPVDVWSALQVPENLPDLVVVQSESFFDARRLGAGVRRDVLATFDDICAEAICSGRLRVPAWGANTVRSEFAFLAGLDEAALGVHRFNPYRCILSSTTETLATRLRAAGYRTVCVHPYPASFYNRQRVFPHLGFDEFVDIEAFADAERAGPYVSDKAVTDKVIELLAGATQPLFIFVITMENHGPLHLERVQPDDLPALYDMPPPGGCDDLTVYLRHLRNADAMIGRLRAALVEHSRPARFCWYGDHVPIMPSVYRVFGDPDGQTEYFVWQNLKGGCPERRPCTLHSLAKDYLNAG